MVEGNKYPPKIQRLFTPRLPFVYKKPVGYYPEERRTARISPLREWRQHIESYKKENTTPIKDCKPSVIDSSQESSSEAKERQLREWQDTEAFNKNEFLKDPYRTVFVARLHYGVSELDVSKTFTLFGAIEAIRVVRNKKTGQSRGYAFVVFETEIAAKNCIRELAPTGIAMKTTDSLPSRKALVDMERGRLVRAWLPRRLGGGLGGRHYTQPSSSHLREASAAASGRRLNLPLNLYQTGKGSALLRVSKRQATDRYGGTPRGGPDQGSYVGSRMSQSERNYTSLPYSPAATLHSVLAARGVDLSLKEKYAKYQSGGSDDRSVRSIRH